VTFVPQERIREIDILRLAAMLLILAAHLASYVSSPELAAREPYLVVPGLSLFVFISGLALDLGRRRMSTAGDVLDFCKRRLLRIYPLYLPALGLFVAMFHYGGLYHQVDFSPVLPNTMIHVMGAQALLSPRVAPMFTLWFIGAILMYYIVYIILVRFCPTLRGLLVGSALLVAPLAAVRLLFGMIDDRFFLYYPFFIVGIVASRTDLLAPGRVTVKRVLATAGVLGAAVLAVWLARRAAGAGGEPSWLDLGISLSGRMVFGAVAVCVMTGLASLSARVMPEKAYAVVLFGSVGSYAVYLFHRPVLSLMTLLMRDALNVPAVPFGVVLVGVGIPLVFVLGYSLQRVQDAAIRLLRRS
jgi:peptidoglycan/LPS O-acetylase OafA/YrhL